MAAPSRHSKPSRSQSVPSATSAAAAAKPARTFVLVGHCLPDRMMLINAIRRAVGGAAIESANDAEELDPFLRGDCVLLVNRVLDGEFETDSGIDLIAGLRGKGETAPVAALISDRPDAQERALRAGAAPGFGKSEVHVPKTVEVLRTLATGPPRGKHRPEDR